MYPTLSYDCDVFEISSVIFSGRPAARNSAAGAGAARTSWSSQCSNPAPSRTNVLKRPLSIAPWWQITARSCLQCGGVVPVKRGSSNNCSKCGYSCWPSSGNARYKTAPTQQRCKCALNASSRSSSVAALHYRVTCTPSASAQKYNQGINSTRSRSAASSSDAPGASCADPRKCRSSASGMLTALLSFM